MSACDVVSPETAKLFAVRSARKQMRGYALEFKHWGRGAGGDHALSRAVEFRNVALHLSKLQTPTEGKP